MVGQEMFPFEAFRLARNRQVLSDKVNSSSDYFFVTKFWLGV